MCSIRGSIKFFLGEFESAIQDFDLAIYLNIKGQSSCTLLERAIAKCVLGRNSEAIQDVRIAAKINVNLNYVRKYQTFLEQILNSRTNLRIFNEPKAVQAM